MGHHTDMRNGPGSAMPKPWTEVELLPGKGKGKVASTPVVARVPFRNPFRWGGRDAHKSFRPPRTCRRRSEMGGFPAHWPAGNPPTCPPGISVRRRDRLRTRRAALSGPARLRVQELRRKVSGAATLVAAATRAPAATRSIRLQDGPPLHRITDVAADRGETAEHHIARLIIDRHSAAADPGGKQLGVERGRMGRTPRHARRP